MFQIDLSPNGEFLLILPVGRWVEISATPVGVEFIRKIILDHRKEIRNQPGYIGTFPTQHAVEKFLKTKKERIAREQQQQVKIRAQGLGVDLDRMEFNI